MQSKINESQTSVERVISQVLSVVGKLEHLKAQEIANIESLEAENSELIVKA